MLNAEEEGELLVNILDKPIKKINKAANELIARYRECKKENKKELAIYDEIFLKNLQQAISESLKIITRLTGINRKKLGEPGAKGLGISDLQQLLNSCNAYFDELKKSKDLGDSLNLSKVLYKTLLQMEFIYAALAIRKKW